MFSNWRQTSGSVLVPHVVPMISGSKLGSDAVPSGSYYDIGGFSSVTPLLCSGEGIVVVAEKWRVPDPGKLSAVAGGIASGAEIGHHVVPSGSYYDIGDPHLPTHIPPWLITVHLYYHHGPPRPATTRTRLQRAVQPRMPHRPVMPRCHVPHWRLCTKRVRPDDCMI